jgi:hypothetical protein
VKPTNPPALATKLLESFVAERMSEALLGDVIEQYEGGRSRAWYWRQVLQALVISAVVKLGGGSSKPSAPSSSAASLACRSAIPRRRWLRDSWAATRPTLCSCRLCSSARPSAAGSCVGHIPGRWWSSMPASASSRVPWPSRCMPGFPFQIGCPFRSSHFLSPSTS